MEDLYSISEMARTFDVSRQTLIYYDKIGLFKPAKVNEKGYRLYAPTQIPHLRLICMLSDLGLSLEKISQLMRHADMDTVAALLRGRVEALDNQIDGLARERADAMERLEFYDAARFWLAHEDEPLLKEFPERYVVVEPFASEAPVDRTTLHPALMRAIARMKSQVGGTAMSGWGAVLRQGALRSESPLAGAGSFVTVSSGLSADAMRRTASALPPASPEFPEGVEVLPAGVYLCLSRWGMPFNLAGLSRLLACMDEHGLVACGDAYDLCYLDTTSYDDEHQEDFCCLQVPVRL